MLKHYLNKYKSQEMYKEIVNAFLPLLKFVPDWFVSNKMPRNRGNAVSLNDDIVFVNADSDNFTFLSDDMGLANVRLNDLSLDDNNFDDDDHGTIIHAIIHVWCNWTSSARLVKKK